eukprot:514457_1
MSRVLSIQSHVVYGYVGNKAAVFPLQLLGFDVDVVNSVHFSCHTGYPKKWEGDVLGGNQLESILDGLQRNELLDDTGHLLTGYIGSETFLRSVLKVLRTLKEQNKDKVRFVCDPVFGDNGKLYVPEELVGIYRDEVIPLANVCTPNQFEIELLTGITVKNIEDGKNACKVLHDLGPELVVITSLQTEEDPDHMSMLASQRTHNHEGDGTTTQDDYWCVESPVLEGSYTGTGDLFAALFLAWTAKEPDNLSLVMERVVSTMYSVIEKTMHASKGTVKSKELQLIRSKAIIEDPPILFRANRL